MAKAPTDIKALARSHGPGAINVLKAVMHCKDAPAPSRVAAATALLDRGYGKPAGTLDTEGLERLVINVIRFGDQAANVVDVTPNDIKAIGHSEDTD